MANARWGIRVQGSDPLCLRLPSVGPRFPPRGLQACADASGNSFFRRRSCRCSRCGICLQTQIAPDSTSRPCISKETSPRHEDSTKPRRARRGNRFCTFRSTAFDRSDRERTEHELSLGELPPFLPSAIVEKLNFHRH